MDLQTVAELPLVRAARTRIRELDGEVLSEQLRLVVIPAPSRAEGERGDHVERRFRDLGLQEVHRDEAGNVLGRLPGSPAGREGAALVTAHLDTVFPAGTPLEPRRVGKRIHAPGITDNCRGLAALLGTVRTLQECEVRTVRPLWFVATVGEEGSGDLYGVKHLFRDEGEWAGAASFLSIDGCGIRRIVHRALGSKRLRVTLRGPGGHSWSDFGTANPIHALGEAIAALRAIQLPAAPPTSLTVARCGGGSSINAIPAEAWLEIDMRSEGREELRALEAAAREAIAAALEAVSAGRRAGTEPLTAAVEVIGDRPSGMTPAGDPLLAAAVAATELLGAEPELVASSTDANVPISLGIPALTIGAGGESGGIHTLDEWYENRDGPEGLERALLTTLAAAGGVAE